MNVGLFHPAFQSVGGAEILAISHAHFLRQAGHSVEVVTFDYRRETWEERLGGVPVHVVRKRHWTEALHLWNRVHKVRSRGRRAEKRLRGLDAIIAYNHPCNVMLGRSLLEGRRIWHCNEPYRSLHPREANPYLTAKVEDPAARMELDALREHRARLEAWSARQTRGGPFSQRRAHDLESVRGMDAIWALSEFTRENLRQAYGLNHVEVIHPMVRFPEHAASSRRRLGLDRSCLRILSHSRLGAAKNIETVLKGLACYLGKALSTAHLHVVGDGEHRPRLEEITRELGLQREVTFHGFLSDAALESVYAACEVFALLPLDEPFGMVFPEAASRGLLLIGPDHGGPLEILEGGRLGWSVPAISPEAFSAALEELRSLGDGEVERRRELADRSCRARYGREAVGRRLLELLGQGARPHAARV